MTLRGWSVVALVASLAAACSSSSSSNGAGAGADAGTAASDAGSLNGDAAVTPGDAGPYFPLGMNDVTILAPLPAALATPLLARGADAADDGAPFVPRALFDRLVAPPPGPPPPPGGSILEPDAYDRLHLVAVRFDLCDRNLPGQCAPGDDGRLRLVFQPVANDLSAEDVGIHAFYAIPNAEIATAVSMLRDLARTQAAPVASPLQPSPALSGASRDAYASKLAAFVRRFGGETKLVRLTINAQPLFVSAIHWVLRGVAKKGASFEDMSIPGGNATVQEVTLMGSAGAPGYDTTPAIDSPSGLLAVLTPSAFDAAADKKSLLEALAAADNPTKSAPDTVPCIACHATSVLTKARATAAGIDPTTLAARYASTYDLSIAAGKSATTDRTLRALGWLGKDPMISQRVANDTAQVLTELAARFPQ